LTCKAKSDRRAALVESDIPREGAVNRCIESPFESIENAHEFLSLLAQTVSETMLDMESDIQRESGSNSARRLEALRTTLYTMQKLEVHLDRSRRALNDLRTLRRLLFEERRVGIAAAQMRAMHEPRAGADVMPLVVRAGKSEQNCEDGCASEMFQPGSVTYETEYEVTS
jgi:hypothetical protein